jgi:hypothetical protein
MTGRAVMSLSAQLSGLPAVRGNAPWPNHEYVKGWGVFGLPFDSGHVLALRVFPEKESRAMLDGADLGLPAHLRDNPTIGGVPLPARGVLATGQAAWEILDPAEYERARSQTATAQTNEALRR